MFNFNTLILEGSNTPESGLSVFLTPGIWFASQADKLDLFIQRDLSKRQIAKGMPLQIWQMPTFFKNSTQ